MTKGQWDYLLAILRQDAPWLHYAVRFATVESKDGQVIFHVEQDHWREVAIRDQGLLQRAVQRVRGDGAQVIVQS